MLSGIRAVGTFGAVIATLGSVTRAGEQAAQVVRPQPEELGKIALMRDFAAAERSCRESGKPMMVLFDEVPGCHTCRQFGAEPLSHPIVVGAADAFVCVAVYNNIPGDDEVVLKRYREPAWNNPVIRFIGRSGRDLILRREGVYTTGGVMARMAAALKAAGRDVPQYLQLALAEYNPGSEETATFAMRCFWEGEAKLGELNGVLATQPGFLRNSEVVELTFDPTVLNYRRLVAQAKRLNMADRVYARSDAQQRIAARLVGHAAERCDEAMTPDQTPQYHLAQRPTYYYLPLTALQATKVNSALASGRNAEQYLTARQIEMAGKLSTILKDDPGAIKSLKPDRSRTGIVAYADRLETRLAALSR